MTSAPPNVYLAPLTVNSAPPTRKLGSSYYKCLLYEGREGEINELQEKYIFAATIYNKAIGIIFNHIIDLL